MAFDLNTGAVKWSKRLQGIDVWTVNCTSMPAGTNCPQLKGNDYDLPGSGPNLRGNVVGFGQKNGIYWALNADTGDIVWSTVAGPGGTLGGMEFGTAAERHADLLRNR